jgi:hypothetical protein
MMYQSLPTPTKDLGVGSTRSSNSHSHNPSTLRHYIHDQYGTIHTAHYQGWARSFKTQMGWNCWQLVDHQLHCNSSIQREKVTMVPQPGEKRSRCEDPTLALLKAMKPTMTGAECKVWKGTRMVEQWIYARKCFSQVARVFLGCTPSCSGIEWRSATLVQISTSASAPPEGEDAAQHYLNKQYSK